MRGIDYSMRQHNLLSINFEQIQNSNFYVVHYASHSYNRNEIYERLIQSPVYDNEKENWRILTNEEIYANI